MNYLFTIFLSLFGVIFGVFGAFVYLKPKNKLIEDSAKKEADRITKDAYKNIENLRNKLNQEEEESRKRIEKTQELSDQRLLKREENIDKKSEKIEESLQQYKKLMRELENEKEKLKDHLDDQVKELAKISKLKPEEAKKELYSKIEKKYSEEFSIAMDKKLELIKEESDTKGSDIIIQSIQRYASSVVTEATISIVKIESEDIKGKIIGREGRNINIFEKLSGVDLIIDDTPGAITISCYDMFRRYVAKIALESLIKDGRMHPSKIEESIKKAEQSADRLILELGQKACSELGVSGFPEPVLKLLGRCRFRSSYGQNVLQHSIEVAYLAQGIAQMLPGADPMVCLKAGLVHDIGKAVSHEVEGGHAVIGKDILEKFGIDVRVVTAMKSHHEDFPYESIESRIIQAADAISAARPGARRETLDKHIKRLKELETISQSFKGVEKSFAIQAGREVRVFVNASEISDEEAKRISFDIARKIENECEYPGEVKVALIRENRFENVAK